MKHNRDLEVNTNNAPDNNPVHEAVLLYWGDRCPEHEDGCPVCEAWRKYDVLIKHEEAHAKLKHNLMVNEMVRKRIDPEIQKAMLKLIMDKNVGKG